MDEDITNQLVHNNSDNISFEVENSESSVMHGVQSDTQYNETQPENGDIDESVERDLVEEEEDDDNYEITDFSMVTPWERFIFDIEEVLRNWGLGHGGLGSGWDGAYPATREHTILNSSASKGVRHRRASLSYLGQPLVIRHVVWLPEGIDVSTQGYCGVESIWRKRSSAATRCAYVRLHSCLRGKGRACA